MNAAELLDPDQTPALGFAHALWGLEADLRQLADRLREGVRP